MASTWTDEPVGTHCAAALLRLEVSPRATIAALIEELRLTRDEARAAVRAARSHLERTPRGGAG